MATTHPGAWSSLLGNASVFREIRETARILYEDSQTALPQPTSRLSAHELSVRLRQLGADFKATAAEASPQQPLVALRIAGTRVHYSTVPLHELDPISIAEMEYNVVHHGRVLLLRIASLSTRTVGITQVIAEDLRGWAIPLTLWRLSLIDSDPSIGEYLPVGSIIAVKEPSLRSTSEGRLLGEGLPILPISIEPSLHIDSNADVVRLSRLSSLLQDTAWSPLQLGFSSPSKTSYLQNQARSAFKSRKWRMARDAYSSAIESMEPLIELQSSLMIERAACQLELQEYYAALQDLYSVRSSAAFPSLGEALQTQTKHLIAKIQYALRHYEDAIAVIVELSDSVESRQDFERTQTRLLEAKTGDYPWIELRRLSLAPDTFFLDVADYIGPVMSSTVPDDGHGSGRKRRLTTTRAAQPGEILLVVKAKASDFVDLQAAYLTLGVDLMNEPPVFPDTLSLSHTALRQAERDPEWAAELSQMYAGPAYKEVESIEPLPGSDVASVSSTFTTMRQLTPWEHGSTLRPVDPARVEGICVNNSTLLSAPPWRKVHSFVDSPASTKAERPQGVALFSAVAHSIRHACRSNSCRSQIGDVLVITASAHIPASAEVHVAYVSPYQPYSYREERLRQYNMSCDCPICQADRFELNQGHTSEVLSRCSSRYQELSEQLPTIPPHELLQIEEEIHDLLQTVEGVYAQFRRFRPLTHSLYKILINTMLRRRAYAQASVQATKIDPRLMELTAMAFESIDAALPVCPYLSPDFDFQGSIFDRFPVLDDCIGVVDLCLLSSVLYENHGNKIMPRRWCEMAEKIHDIHMGPGHWAISRQNQPHFGFSWRIS